MNSAEPLLPHTYLLFHLGGETFGFEARFLGEVANRTVMTEVPRSSGFLIGAAQVHGKIVPVVDLAGFLGFSPPESARAGGFVVVALPGPKPILAGFYVERVVGFAKVSPEGIMPIPSVEDGTFIPFLAGRGKDPAGGTFHLIQMDRLIASQARGKTLNGFPEPVRA